VFSGCEFVTWGNRIRGGNAVTEYDHVVVGAGTAGGGFDDLLPDLRRSERAADLIGAAPSRPAAASGAA
jgi:hypothetical protein